MTYCECAVEEFLSEALITSFKKLKKRESIRFHAQRGGDMGNVLSGLRYFLKGGSSCEAGTKSVKRDLRKWKILKDLPEFLLCQVVFAIVARRSDKEWFDYAILVTRDDEVWVLGDNRHGQLGMDRKASKELPVTLNSDLSGRGLYGFSASWTHVAGWTDDGKLWMWGNNEEGHLGQGHSNPVYAPQQVITGLEREEVVKAACGGDHTLCLTASGRVFGWGQNEFCQTGSDSEASVLKPTLVKFGGHNVTIVDIACTARSSLALSADGKVYAWGCNLEGEVGIGSMDGYFDKPMRVPFPDGESIKDIACGYNHCVALTCEGGVYVWGGRSPLAGNDEDRAGRVSMPLKLVGFDEKVVRVSASNGDFTSVFETGSGKIYESYVGINTLEYTGFRNFDEFFAYHNLGMDATWISQEVKPPKELDLPTLYHNSCHRTVAFEVEGIRILGSKFYLKRCKYFRDRLEGEWKKEIDGFGFIKIKEFAFPVFEAFVEFLHSDKLDVEEEYLTDLLRLGKLYDMKIFRDKVTERMRGNISSYSAIMFYVAAKECNEPALGLFVLNFMKRNLTEILEKSDLEKFDAEVIVNVLQDLKSMGSFRRRT